jgi:hypothetical protein
MFIKCKNAKQAYKELFYYPVVLGLLNIGIPKEYGKDMAERMINQAISDFEKMEMTRYIRWYCDGEIAKIKAGVEKEGKPE